MKDIDSGFTNAAEKSMTVVVQISSIGSPHVCGLYAEAHDGGKFKTSH